MKWHPFAEKFPLLTGQEWESFKESIKATGGNAEDPVLYRAVGTEKQGLDGRNREKACQELGLDCTYKLVRCPDGDVEDFISRKNIHRRHMSAELRKTIVAKLHSDGESQRQIAKVVGVGVGTVSRDIAEIAEEIGSGVPNGTPEPPPAQPVKVTGADGKSYPAKGKRRPKTTPGDAFEGEILCSRCKRTGAVKDCPKCKEARTEKGVDAHGRKKKTPRKPEPRTVVKDKTGAVVPDHCRDAFADPSLGEMIEELEHLEAMFSVDDWTKRAGKLTDHYGFILIEKFAEHSLESLHRLQLAAEALKAGIPHALCPKCNAVDSKKDGKCCRGCRGYGHVPEARFVELTK